MRADGPVDAALAAIAATGLATRLAAPTEPLDPSQWRALCTGITEHRLAGHLAHAIGSGTLPVSEGQADEAADLDESWQRQALALDRLLLRVASALACAEVPFRVLKGAALAHTVYDDPAMRVYGDVDVLVPGASLAVARAVLVDELDGTDILPELRPGFDAEFGKDVVIRVGDFEIDLHRTLASGAFGLRIPVADLFDTPAPFFVGGVELRTLGAVPTFVQVCYNAALGDIPPRLSSLRDVAQVHLVLQPSLNEVLELASAWGGTSVVARAVSLCWSTLGLPACEVSEWAAAYSPGLLDRRLLAASTSEQRSYTRSLSSLAAIGGVRAKARYTRAIVSPSAEYMDARGWTRGGHLRRAAQGLWRGR